MAALIPYFISNIFQIGAYAFCIAYLSDEIAELKKRPLTTGISFIVMYFTSIIIQRYDNDWVAIGLSLILSLYCLLLYLNTSKTLSQCFNIVICGYLIETLCQCIFILLFTILHVPLDANGYNDPISLSIVFLGALLLIPVLYFLPVRKWVQSLANISYSTSLIVVLVMIIISVMSLKYNDVSLGLLLPTVTSIAFFFFLGVLIIMQSLSDQRRKQAIRDYETYMPILNDMIQNIHKQQHLYNNQIASLVHLADSYHDYDSLSHALKSYSNFEENIIDNESYSFLHIENKLLASLLYCKFHEAASSGKNLIVTVDDYHYESPCTDTEIVDIVGILIDNALEASAENDTIYVTLGKRSDSGNPFFINVANPGPLATPSFVHDIFATHYTTKRNQVRHGLGLDLLKTFVDTYNGSITVGNTYPDEISSSVHEQYIFFEVEI